MRPTRSPGLRPRSCSSRATRALASSRARYVIAALSTRTATRPAWARVVSVRFLARFVTLFIVRPQARVVVGPRYQACPRALVGRRSCGAGGPMKRVILVLPARYLQVRPGLASWSTPRKGTGCHGIRRLYRDPARQPEQVRGRPRQRPDPAGPDAVHLDRIPGRLRLRAQYPGRGRRSARRAGAGAW